MSDKPGDQTLRLVEGCECHRCIMRDRYLRFGKWPGVSHRHRKRHSWVYGDAEQHAISNIVTMYSMDNSTECHGWTHRHPEQTRVLGYLFKSYDPEPGTMPVYSVRRG